MQVVSNYIGRYGVRYSIEQNSDESYTLYCLNSKQKSNKEEIVKQSYFKGSASECLTYLKTIEKSVKVC